MVTQAPTKPVQVKKPAGPSANFATVLKQAAPWLHPMKLAQLAEEFARADAKRMGLGGDGSPQITGPTTAYDDATGEPKFRVGEGGPEHVSITPEGGGQGGPTPGPDGTPGYVVGGSFDIYGNQTQQKPADPSLDVPPRPQQMIKPPTFQGGGGMAAPGPSPVVSPPRPPAAPAFNGQFQPPGPGTVDPITGQYWATQRLFGTQQGVNNAQGNVYDIQNGYNAVNRGTLGALGAVNAANRATLGPSAAVNQAKAEGLAARSTQTAAQSAFLAEQERENQTRRGEFDQEQAAANDVQDKQAVGQAQLYRQSRNQRYSELGAVAPVAVDMPVGYNGPMPGGTEAKLSTHEDQLAKQIEVSQKGRSFAIEAARLATAQAGQQVTLADIKEGRAQLSVDAAQQAVKAAGFNYDDAKLMLQYAGMAKDDAELALQRAGLTHANAQLEYNQGQQPPAPGEVLYQDPRTGLGQYMTPLARAQKQRQDNLEFGNQNNSTQYSNDPTYGYLSDSEMLSALVAGTANVTALGVMAELQARGYSARNANDAVQAAMARSKGNAPTIQVPTLGAG